MKITELDSPIVGGTACLVQIDDAYYRVSSIPAAPDHGGPETLAFVCDEDGEVTSWTDVAGGRGRTREETIKELVENGADPDGWGRGATDEDGNFDRLGVIGVVLDPPGPEYYTEEAKRRD